MSRFSGLSVVITGGTNGIGLAVAKRILDEGGKVLVTGTDSGRLATTEAFGENIHVLKNDAADPLAATALAKEAQRLFGQIDGVFLNAGRGMISPLGEITLAAFREVFELNVAGVLFGAQALAPLIKSGGSMLLNASAAKTKGLPDFALYAASKGAVRSLTLVLARALGSQGVRVNTLSPGPIDTDFHGAIAPTAEKKQEIDELLNKMIPLGRMGRVEEAAAVAAFLLSPEASFITGADYAVDGGEAQL